MFRYHLLSDVSATYDTSLECDHAILAQWPTATRELLRQAGPDVYIHEVLVDGAVVAHIVCVRMK